MVVTGDGGYRSMGYVMAHQLFKLYPLQECVLVEYVKVRVCGGDTA